MISILQFWACYLLGFFLWGWAQRWWDDMAWVVVLVIPLISYLVYRLWIWLDEYEGKSFLRDMET